MKTETLLQRMSAITAEAQAIPKRGYNSYSNYYYVMAVDVIEELQKLFTKWGVQLIISEKSLERINPPGNKNFYSTLKCTATFLNIDNPLDKIEVDYFSVSADTLDKDIFKAKTNGLKYLLTQQFLIVTNDLIDTEDSKHEPIQDKPVKKDSIVDEVKKAQVFANNSRKPDQDYRPIHEPNTEVRYPVFGFCSKCFAPMYLSKKGTSIYCSNYRNCPEADRADYKGQQQLPAEINTYEKWMHFKTKPVVKNTEDVNFTGAY